MTRQYAIIVHGLEARSSDAGKTIMARAGERFWIVTEPEGWVEATSTRISEDVPAVIPADIKTFNTRAEAKKFAQRWTGHPWWCKPNGTFEIIPVTPKYVTHQCGWRYAR